MADDQPISIGDLSGEEMNILTWLECRRPARLVDGYAVGIDRYARRPIGNTMLTEPCVGAPERGPLLVKVMKMIARGLILREDDWITLTDLGTRLERDLHCGPQGF